MTRRDQQPEGVSSGPLELDLFTRDEGGRSAPRSCDCSPELAAGSASDQIHRSSARSRGLTIGRDPSSDRVGSSQEGGRRAIGRGREHHVDASGSARQHLGRPVAQVE
jgi:hypothetical protein